jgi:hypothetical protein
MQPSVLPLCVQPPLEFGVLPGVVAALRCLPVRSSSLLAYQSRSLLYVTWYCLPLAYFPCPSVCVGLAFFVALGRVGSRPLLCAQGPQVYKLLSDFFSLRVSCETVLFS